MRIIFGFCLGFLFAWLIYGQPELIAKAGEYLVSTSEQLQTIRGK